MRGAVKALLAASVAALAIGTGVSTAAGAEPLPMSLEGAGYDHVDLRGAAAARQLEIAVPRRWRSASGRVLLRLRASRGLAERSTLELLAGGKSLGRRPLEPGRSTQSVTLPRVPVRDGRIEIELRTRLRTKGESCPAADDAKVRIRRGTRLDLLGTRSPGTPPLSQLPDALVERHGSWAAPLTVRFAGSASTDGIRAAGVAAGWVARAAGDPGVDVRVAGRSHAPVAGWPELVVEPTGRSRVSVTERPDRGLTVTIGGRGEELLRAAWALGPRTAAQLRGRRTSQLPEIALPEERRLPQRLPIPAQRLDTAGPEAFQLEVPAWIEVQRAARLELIMSRKATAGREASVSVNGIGLTAREPEAKPGRPRAVLASVADKGPPERAQELAAGKNFVGLELSPDDEHACELNTVDLDARSGLGVRARWREPGAELGLWPFPLDRKPGWSEAEVVLPERPTNGQLGAAIASLAAAARVSDRPSLAQVRFESRPRTPARDALLLVERPADVPDWARDELGRTPRPGMLAALRVDDRTVFLAVGRRALRPLAGAYMLGSLRGEVIVTGPRGKTRLVGGSSERPSAVEWRPLDFELPQAILAAGLGLLAAMTFWAVVRRLTGFPTPPGGS